MNLIYSSLNKISFLKKSYSLKFLFIAFLGIHIPLIGIIVFIINNPSQTLSKVTIVLITLALTLIAALVTLTILRNLLAPLIESKKALEHYLYNGKLPELPENFTDEAGVLMNLIQKSIHTQDLLSKEKQEITTLVSHNLRTPLNQIKGLCEIMKFGDEDEKTIYLDKISKIADMQLDTLSDLLNQLMHKDFDFSPVSEEYNVTDLIEQEIAMVEISLRNKNLTVILENTNEVFKTHLNPKKLALVLQNLISNAIKFSFEDAKIIVGVRNFESRLEIYVKDEGIGFSKEYKNNIFKDARKTGRKGTKNEPSVGLGLHLCKRTMNQLGGELVAESDGENKGATFKIII